MWVQFFMQYLIADASLKYLVTSLKPKRPIPWDIYLAQVAPVGVAMGLDIGQGRTIEKKYIYITKKKTASTRHSSFIFLCA